MTTRIEYGSSSDALRRVLSRDLVTEAVIIYILETQ